MLLEAKVHGRPWRLLPFDAVAVIVKVTGTLMFWVTLPGDSVTELTGRSIRTVFVPDFPPEVAVMVAFPAATPVTVKVTWPDASVVPDVGATVATDVELLDRVTVWPESGVDAASVTVTTPGNVPPPEAGRMSESGVIATATVFGPPMTMSVAVPVTGGLWPCEEAVAVIVTAWAAATPVATPVELFTVALDGSLLDHVSVRPDVLSGCPPASRSVALNVVVAPTCTDAVDG